MQDENKPEDLVPQAPKPDIVSADPIPSESQAPTPPTPSAKTVDPIAAPVTTAPAAPQGNTSGQGSSVAVPEEIKGWSWGGFLLSWIWAIGNQVWIGLLALVPYVGFVMTIVLGIKGREWAWQAKRWDSVEHFKRVQRNWSVAGIIIMVAAVILPIIIVITIVALNPASGIQ